MTNKIALTASMRSNLLSLKNTQSLMDKTQDHLSSGYKVNSAMDNPSSYFTAQALNSRANDLSTLLDSIGQAISTLEVADQGITTLQEFVEQAKSVANSARDTSNVSASVASSIKFDNDALTSQLVAGQAVPNAAANDSEARLGPYVLHDFFLFHYLVDGAPAATLRELAQIAFVGEYSQDVVEETLSKFLRRFRAAQYKRNCVPDGPKITLSLSPRADWRMPSDM